jgi:hypothetical protein
LNSSPRPKPEDLKPRKRGKARLGVNPIAFAELCKMLHLGAWTREQLAHEVGVTPATVTRWMNLLKARHLVFISKWKRVEREDGGVGVYVAHWSWGYICEDEPKPKPLPYAVTNKNYRIAKKVKANRERVDNLINDTRRMLAGEKPLDTGA